MLLSAPYIWLSDFILRKFTHSSPDTNSCLLRETANVAQNLLMIKHDNYTLAMGYSEKLTKDGESASEIVLHGFIS